MFFSQPTIEIVDKLLLLGKKHKKTNILLFSADIHTYKLTFVSFFMFFLHLPLSNGGKLSVKTEKNLHFTISGRHKYKQN